MSRKWGRAEAAPPNDLGAADDLLVPTPRGRSANSWRATRTSSARVASPCSAFFVLPSTSATLWEPPDGLTCMLYSCVGYRRSVCQSSLSRATWGRRISPSDSRRAGGRGPADRFVEHFAPLCTPQVLFIQPLSRPLRGVDGLRRMAEPLFEAMPDHRARRGSPLGATDDGVMIELRLRGTLDGRPLEWITLDRIVLRAGLMAERRAYFDPMPLLPAMLSRPRGLPCCARCERSGDEPDLAGPGPRKPAASTCRRRIRCFEAGTGEPIVFVHGLLVNANLWRKVVAKLSPDFHCVALDLPLGSHRADAGRHRPEPARDRRDDRRALSTPSASRT